MDIKVLAYSSAPMGLTAFVLILWGLRLTEPTEKGRQRTEDGRQRPD